MSYLRKIPQEAAAIIFMITGMACFSVVDNCIRHLSGNYHSSQLVFLRSAAALIIAWPLIVNRVKVKVSGAAFRLYLVRGCIAVMTLETWFFALSKMPVAEATALSFCAPIFSAIMAVAILKEKITLPRLIGIAAGICGALIIIRPGAKVFDPMALTALFAAFLMASQGILVKGMTKTEPPLAIAFHLFLFMTVLSFPFALTTWQSIRNEDVALLAFMGAVSIAGQYFLTKALASAEVTTILPFEFTRLLVSSVIAHYAFGELYDYWTFAGAVVIILGALVASKRMRGSEIAQ